MIKLQRGKEEGPQGVLERVLVLTGREGLGGQERLPKGGDF